MKNSVVAATLAVAGLIFSWPLSAQSAQLKVLHNFAAFGSTNDGSIPYGPLVLDAKGNVYGVTIDGGNGCDADYGCGTAFELSPLRNGNWRETILHEFASTDGSPWSALIFDATGNLYGTAMGGVSGSGAYELSPGSEGWIFSVLYADGAGPGLLMDNLRNLYGAIGPGDYFGLGAIGELSPGSSGWTYTQLYSFTCDPTCGNGYNPPAPPIWDGRGNLWGTMTMGGTGQPACISGEGCGVIFAMTPNGDGTWSYHVMHLFAASIYDGQRPYGSLVMDSAGNFYGSTWLGGRYNNGTIFKFSHASGKWKETILYDFPNCHVGCQADGTLAMYGAGNLYGTADGGMNSCDGLACGVVFKLAPQTNGTWRYSMLYNFNITSGGVSPFYGVILDSRGNLYGVTSSFGKYGGGTAFEITP
jgi:uncharacterized repeat protein (TIGR03803 family)